MTDDWRQAAEEKILAALARREYAYHELLSKYSSAFDAALISAILDELVAKGWQSDARYAHSYTQSAVGRGKGELVIRQHLRQQQVDERLIDAALAEHDFYALAASVYAKKYRTRAGRERKELARRQRFLAQRGFSFDQIHEAMQTHEQ